MIEIKDKGYVFKTLYTVKAFLFLELQDNGLMGDLAVDLADIIYYAWLDFENIDIFRVIDLVVDDYDNLPKNTNELIGRISDNLDWIGN